METKLLRASMPTILPTFDAFITEGQNSRLVPSPTKLAVAGGSDLFWPSLYGNPPVSPGYKNKDTFLGQYIHKIYCRECRDKENMASGQQLSASDMASTSTHTSGSQPNSPPQYTMDQMSLAAAMDANKEALGRRLLLRRSVNELVDQGIYPSHPAAFAIERRHLQIAQTGDKLKHKIQSRPDRQFLVQHHILEDSNVDPSLQSARRKLKKAKLTDELNEKLANRPGPLELVEQHILEAEDPIVDAIKEGKLEYRKTLEGFEPTQIPKLPYEVESPKSGSSSPEPLECDNDSNNSSNTSTGFSLVPSPPDISPLLRASHQHITIGGHTIEIPITTQSFTSPGSLTTVPLAPQHFTPAVPTAANIMTINQPYQQQTSHLRHNSFGAARSNRKVSKQSRPKQQTKQRVIKFHEYKGPNNSAKSNNTQSYSSSGGTFVTTTGPLQKLDSLTPYQLRMQQQQLYLQCQLEVQNKGSLPTTVYVPLHTQASAHQVSVSKTEHDIPAPSPAPTIKTEPLPVLKSRPVTPALRSPLAMTTNAAVITSIATSSTTTAKPLHVSRSLSNLEDMKVADLKCELKMRNLPVSGSKPQLIERLRNHQLQELNSTNIPSVGSYSDISSYSNIASVQSVSDESFKAPSSVVSMSAQMSPPTSPFKEITPPASVVSKHHQDMDTDENSQGIKTAEEIVREQARKIEELQRALVQSQKQLQLVQVQQPFLSSLSTIPVITSQIQVVSGRANSTTTSVSSQRAQQTPVDITNKQVYVATSDGKMTACKVVFHNPNGMTQSGTTTPNTSIKKSPAQSNTGDVRINMPTSMSTTANLPSSSLTKGSNSEGANSNHIDVDDVLEVLIRTGEFDPNNVIASKKDQNQSSTSQPTFTSTHEFISDTNINTDLGHNALDEPMSSLVDMDWIENDTGNHYLNDLPESHTGNMVDDNCNLDWLSDVMQLDTIQIPPRDTMSSNDRLCSSSNNPANSSLLSLSIDSYPSSGDPVLGQKSHDVLNIFNIDETDFRHSTNMPTTSVNWK